MHRLQRGRHARTFLKQSDSDIAKTIAGGHGLQPQVDSTKTAHDYVIQDAITDAEFLRRLAARNGYEFWVDDTTLYFKKPPLLSDGPELTYGDDLVSFDAELAASEQVSEVVVRGWDPIKKAEITGQSSRGDSATSINAGSTGSAAGEKAFGKQSVVLSHQRVVNQAQADAVAQSVLTELEQEFIRAEGTAIERSTLKVGTNVTVNGVGSRFSGKYYVTELTHRYDSGGFRTDFVSSGRRANDVFNVLSAPAQPRFQILPGVVTDNTDPDGHGRVKVKLPQYGDDIVTYWCRVATAGAGKDRGVQFLPEVDDEVLVIGSDPHELFVVGGLWNQKDAPAEKTTENVSGGEVQRRIIKSRTGHIVTLDDSSGSPGITIEDSTGNNSIHIDTQSNAMTIKVDGDLTIDAGGKISIKSGQAFEMEAGTSLSTKSTAGTDIEATAQLSLKGSASATLDGGPTTAVKGAIVNIGP